QNAASFELEDYDGLIGQDFLRNFDVYLDYPHDKIYLVPNDRFRKRWAASPACGEPKAPALDFLHLASLDSIQALLSAAPFTSNEPTGPLKKRGYHAPGYHDHGSTAIASGVPGGQLGPCVHATDRR
ncbi:MAG: hypothetical protein WBV40_12475, partial [Candidatus Cybelea sp.]